MRRKKKTNSPYGLQVYFAELRVEAIPRSFFYVPVIRGMLSAADLHAIISWPERIGLQLSLQFRLRGAESPSQMGAELQRIGINHAPLTESSFQDCQHLGIAV